MPDTVFIASYSIQVFYTEMNFWSTGIVAIATQVTVAATFFHVAYRTHFLAIVRGIVHMVTIDMIDLGPHHAWLYPGPVYETDPTQMTVNVAADAGAEWSHSWGVVSGTTACYMAMTTHRPITFSSLLVGTRIRDWTATTVIDTRGRRVPLIKQHAFLSVAIISQQAELCRYFSASIVSD